MNISWNKKNILENFREKEKGEIKDRKVLEVLQIKDDRIEELQHVNTEDKGTDWVSHQVGRNIF